MYEIIYKEKKYFKDLEDGHLYVLGDKFPFDNREINENRLKLLISKKVIKRIITEKSEKTKTTKKKK
ncbi:MAG: hypothetical protein PHU05_04125 [Bacilli bacterium]|nr:hypothetical protein [Bacilli bacterium]